GPGGLGTLAANHLVYVEARLQGRAVAAPPRRPESAPNTDLAGRHDPGAWPYVAAWFVGLVVVSVACWWLWLRWGILRAWLLGAPMLLGLLWGLSYEAMRLLPNVY